MLSQVEKRLFVDRERSDAYVPSALTDLNQGVNHAEDRGLKPPAPRGNRRKPMDAIDEYHAHNLERRLANAMRVGVLTGGVKAALGTLHAARASQSAARVMLIDDAITELQRTLDTAEGERTMEIATPLPAPAFPNPSRFDPMLLGKRVRHKSLGIVGRLSGDYRLERTVLWYRVETNADGRSWWAESNVAFLGSIPMGDGPVAA